MLYNDARTARKIRVDRWQRAYRLVHNMAWSPLRESWLPSPAASEIYPIISALVGWMTDIRPGVSCLPAMDPGTPIAAALQQLGRDLQTCITSSSMNNEEDRQIEQVLWDAMVYGTGFFKTIWEPSLADGEGDAFVRRLDPFALYPDPQAHSFEDSNYILEVRRMSIQEIDRRFPGTAKKINKEGGTIDESIDERQNILTMPGRTPMANTAAISPVTAPRWGLPGQTDREHVFRDEGVTVFECWLREHEQDKQGHLIDRWRMVIIAADTVLMDVYAEDIYKHQCHPYSRYVLSEMGEFWGISLVDHLAPLQVALNRLLAALQSHAELCGNPVFLEPSNSGIPRTRITNKAGQRLTVNAGAVGSVQWLTPPDMPQGVSNLVQFYISEMERVSGLSAMVRGFTPQGRNSEGVIDSVQEAAFVRVRLALRSLESSIRDAYRKKASLISEFYTDPRMIAIVGDSGQQTSMQLRQNHFYAQDIGEKEATPFRFTLLVQSGGTQPLSREKRQADAMRLFVVGGVDRVALLEAFDYPNRDQINQRIAGQEAQGTFQPPGARQRTRNS
jgi:hypothetical protein